MAVECVGEDSAYEDYTAGQENRFDPTTTGDVARVSHSRAAILSLTETLTRQAMPALLLTVVGSIALCLYEMIAAPGIGAILRSTLWLALILPPLSFAIRRLHRYRHGLSMAGRPLTWRAGHTACLGMASTALGAGAYLLSPASPMTLCLLSVLCLIASAGHLAHPRAAIAAAAPAISVILATAAYGGAAPAVAWSLGAVFALACLAGMLRHRSLAQAALEHHPRQETLSIKARRRKTTSAYNPFAMPAKKSANPDVVPRLRAVKSAVKAQASYSSRRSS